MQRQKCSFVATVLRKLQLRIDSFQEEQSLRLREKREFALSGELSHQSVAVERDHHVNAPLKLVGADILHQNLAGKCDLLSLRWELYGVAVRHRAKLFSDVFCRSIQIGQDNDSDPAVGVVRQECIEPFDATVVRDHLAPLDRLHTQSEGIVLFERLRHLLERRCGKKLPAKQT